MMDKVTFGGAMIPDIGLGTFRFSDDEAAEAARAALKMGYRHIDTAGMYGNEKGVGRGIRAAAVPRDQFFVTTRVWYTHLHREGVLASIKTSLARLELDHVDLALIHWPSPDGAVPVAETLGALAEAREQGLIKRFGVSNFTPALLERALETPDGAGIATNQVEVHPWLANRDLVACCQQHGLPVTAYRPLARGRAARDPVLKTIARKYNAHPAQVALSWLLGRGLIVIPASRNPEHLKLNFHARDLRLDDEDRTRIDALDEGLGLVNPDLGPGEPDRLSRRGEGCHAGIQGPA